jgi:hypothetical protein
MAEAAKEHAKRSASGTATGPADATAEPPAHTQTGCPVAWCPICMAVTAVQPLRPEVIEHLLKAGTEMLLAVRGVIDARADEMQPPDDEEPGPTRLEKIDIG